MIQPPPVAAHHLKVTIVNKPIAATAVVDGGEILLPLRAAFEALYSTVSYDPAHRLIMARNIVHLLQMHVDSRVAVLDGRARVLHIRPRVIHGNVYVPLRFAAEAMGAIVRYDSATETIAINGSDKSSTAPYAAYTPEALIPPPNSSVLTAYPVISAAMISAAKSRDVRLVIDGADVTSNASFDGRTITYVPQSGLPPGRHTVGITAHANSGQLISTQWSFVTNAPAVDAANAYPYAPYQFYAAPTQGYAGGTWMNMTMIGPPNGSGFVQICNPNVIYPLWNGGGPRYRARIALPPFYANGGCPINAVFIDGSGRHVVIMPTSNGLYLTGNPLHPFGQYPAGPSIVPILALPFH